MSSQPEEVSVLKNKIEFLIEQDINPGLESHDGFVEFLKIELVDDEFYIHLRFSGSCGGCKSSTGSTLKFIQNHFRMELENEKVFVVNAN